MSRYSDAIVADTPAGYWKLSETASTFADSSGNGNSGTWTGDATGTRGVFGGLAPDQQDGAIKCNGDGAGGAQGNYCAVPSGAGARPAAVNFTGKFTLEAWVYPISRPSAGNVSCIIESYVGGGLNGYALRMDENGFLQAYTIDGTGPAAVTQGVTALTVKRWAHVACVYDQTNLTTYINGVLDKQTANTTNPASGTGPLRIGARGDDAAAIFTGHIDDAAVYATNLTVTQLLNHYNVGARLLGTITPAGTLTKLDTPVTKTGTITPAGTLGVSVDKGLVGTFGPIGTLSINVGKPLAGTIIPAGTLGLVTNKALSGTITPVGTLTTQLLTEQGLLAVQLLPSGLLSDNLLPVTVPGGPVP